MSQKPLTRNSNALVAIVFCISTTGASAFAESNTSSRSMSDEICQEIIPFAQDHGAEISDQDLYHCHVVVNLKPGENRTYSNDDTWNFLSPRRWGYICHAHEKDGRRTTDNFNIFYKDGISTFWGSNSAVAEEEILQRFSLPKEQFLVSWTNIYFFPEGSPQCAELAEASVRTCGQRPICIGLESSRYGRSSEEIIPDDPNRKPWEY